MADIIAIPEIGELPPAGGAEFFLQRREVRKSLAGMVEIGQRVDDRNTRVRRQSVEGFLSEYARYDSLHPARKAPRHIGNSLAPAQSRVCVVEENGRSAHVNNADFEGDARAQGRLFKNHRQQTARE